MRLGALWFGWATDGHPYIAWHWRWSLTWSWCVSVGTGYALRPSLRRFRYNNGGQLYAGALGARLVCSWQDTMRKGS